MCDLHSTRMQDDKKVILAKIAEAISISSRDPLHPGLFISPASNMPTVSSFEVIFFAFLQLLTGPFLPLPCLSGAMVLIYTVLI